MVEPLPCTFDIPEFDPSGYQPLTLHFEAGSYEPSQEGTFHESGDHGWV